MKCFVQLSVCVQAVYPPCAEYCLQGRSVHPRFRKFTLGCSFLVPPPKGRHLDCPEAQGGREREREGPSLAPPNPHQPGRLVRGPVRGGQEVSKKDHFLGVPWTQTTKSRVWVTIQGNVLLMFAFYH